MLDVIKKSRTITVLSIIGYMIIPICIIAFSIYMGSGKKRPSPFAWLQAYSNADQSSVKHTEVASAPVAPTDTSDSTPSSQVAQTVSSYAPEPIYQAAVNNQKPEDQPVEHHEQPHVDPTATPKEPDATQDKPKEDNTPVEDAPKPDGPQSPVDTPDDTDQPVDVRLN